MELLLTIGVVIALVIGVSGFFARPAGRMVLAAPIVIVAIGVLWVVAALTYYQRSTGRQLQGLVGVHYSVPDWGFQYAPGGAEIERASFHVPAIFTIMLLVGSAVMASIRSGPTMGLLRTLSVWIFHIGCAIAFAFVYAVLWFEAASVFI